MGLFIVGISFLAMAITRKQAKIYALRWVLGVIDGGLEIDTMKQFTPYEAEKILEELNKFGDSVESRLHRLGDNPSITDWASDTVSSVG